MVPVVVQPASCDRSGSVASMKNYWRGSSGSSNKNSSSSNKSSKSSADDVFADEISASLPLVWSLSLEDDEEMVDPDRAALIALPIDESLKDNDRDSLSIFKLIQILARQIAFAVLIGKLCPKLGGILAKYQCNHGGMSERPPPFSFDESGNLVLDAHLNYPRGVSTIPGTWTKVRTHCNSDKTNIVDFHPNTRCSTHIVKGVKKFSVTIDHLE